MSNLYYEDESYYNVEDVDDSEKIGSKIKDINHYLLMNWVIQVCEMNNILSYG